MYMTAGLLSTTARSTTRPPILAGPIERAAKESKIGERFFGSPAWPGSKTPAKDSNIIVPNNHHPKNRYRFMAAPDLAMD
jgi:hypothetical protein